MTIIAAGGAGADGKTAVLELVAKYWDGEGKRPLAIDADPERRKAWMDLCHGKAKWQDVLTGPGITDQKTDFVPDADEDHDDGHHCGHPHHRHGPHCQH